MAGQMPVVVVPGGEFAVALRDRLLPGRDDPCYFRRLCLYLCFCVLVFVAQPAGSTAAGWAECPVDGPGGQAI